MRLFGGEMRTLPYLPLRLLVEPELVAGRIGEGGKRPHVLANVRAWRDHLPPAFSIRFSDSVMLSTMM